MSGGLVLYPTETYYALGCLANAPAAVANIYKVKDRQKSHPLPMVAASQEQAARACSLDAVPTSLLQFWPGPLTVLVPRRQDSALASQLANHEGLVAMRVSSHPQVNRLCTVTNFPLTASSANISGCPPARTTGALADALMQRLIEYAPNSGVLVPETEQNIPAGGSPSTIVRPLDGNRLMVHRLGAISLQSLQDAGFTCIVEPHATS